MNETPEMSYSSREARSWILERLREGLVDPSAAFKVPGPAELPATAPTPLTSAPDGGPRALAAQFGASLEGVQGTYEEVESPDAVAERIAAHIAALAEEGGADGLSFGEVLAWSPEFLGVGGVTEQLKSDGISVTVPSDLHDAAERRRAASAAVGITSVDAALASTGTLVMRASAGQSRAASLLPLHHIALVPTSKIHGTVEAWIASLRQSNRLDEVLRAGSQLTLVTGPSKSADIELTLTLGVHGPGTVHAIVYDDQDPTPVSRDSNRT
jgi:L-lactate dehydrogenase complex protein LldG